LVELEDSFDDFFAKADTNLARADPVSSPSSELLSKDANKALTFDAGDNWNREGEIEVASLEGKGDSEAIVACWW